MSVPDPTATAEATETTEATEPASTGEASATGEDSDAAGPAPEAPRYVRMRRAPRYGNFMLTGGVAGVVIGVLLTITQPQSGEFSQKTVVGYVAAILGLVGVVAGAFVAILVDKRRRRADPR